MFVCPLRFFTHLLRISHPFNNTFSLSHALLPHICYCCCVLFFFLQFALVSLIYMCSCFVYFVYFIILSTYCFSNLNGLRSISDSDLYDFLSAMQSRRYAELGFVRVHFGLLLTRLWVYDLPLELTSPSRNSLRF